MNAAMTNSAATLGCGSSALPMSASEPSRSSASDPSRSRRRSMASATAPPQSAVATSGISWTTPTRPTAVDDFVSSNTCTGSATYVMNEPKALTHWPMNSRRKSRCLRRGVRSRRKRLTEAPCREAAFEPECGGDVEALAQTPTAHDIADASRADCNAGLARALPHYAHSPVRATTTVTIGARSMIPAPRCDARNPPSDVRAVALVLLGELLAERRLLVAEHEQKEGRPHDRSV